ELVANRLRGAAVADQKAALGGNGAQGEGARAGARQDEGNAEHDPEQQRLATAQRCPGDHEATGKPGAEGAQGRDLEQLRCIVQGRLAQQRLVAVIEAEYLGPNTEGEKSEDSEPGDLESAARGQGDGDDRE